MLRVLEVIPSFRPAYSYGGPIESSYHLCRYLAMGGAEVRVLTTNADGIGRVTGVPTGIDIALGARATVRYCSKIARHSVSIELLAVLDEYVRWADVVHLTGTYNFTTFPTLWACRRRSKPLLWSPRGSMQDFRRIRRRRLKMLWCRLAQQIAPADFVMHVTSELEKAQSAEFIHVPRSVVIPNGIEIPPTATHAPASDNDLRLAFIGRLDPKKGLENLLEGGGILAAENFGFRLRIAGEGSAHYTAGLHSLARRLAIAERVEFAGDLRDEAKRALLENADVLVVPSHVENFGIVVAEGLAHGLPVIASRGTPWARMEEIGCGLWVDNDPVSLATAIRRISTMPLTEMGARGRRWMERDFSWPMMAGRMLECMRRMAAGPGLLEGPMPSESSVCT